MAPSFNSSFRFLQYSMQPHQQRMLERDQAAMDTDVSNDEASRKDSVIDLANDDVPDRTYLADGNGGRVADGGLEGLGAERGEVFEASEDPSEVLPCLGSPFQEGQEQDGTCGLWRLEAYES